MRVVSLACIAALALAGHPLEDPTCTQPERLMVDKQGTVKLRELQERGLTYDANMFDIQDGDAAALKSGAEVPDRILFKAPVHTCRIKLMPGVREWVTTEPQQYGVPIEVAPYSQPPNFNFISSDNRLQMRVVVRDDATVADINNFLAAHGAYRLGEEPIKPVAADSVQVDSDGSTAAASEGVGVEL